MMARVWRGAVAFADGDAYAQYMRDTGIIGYAETRGNRGVWMLRRTVEDKEEFVMFTLWDSLVAIKGFAGENPERAVFYPEDDRYLIERDDFVSHFEVVTHVPRSANCPANP
jgi:heme-degrading monooxygenase HmoA